MNYSKNKNRNTNHASKKSLTIKARHNGKSFFCYQKLEFHSLHEAEKSGFTSIPSISIENMVIGSATAGWSGDWHNEPFPLIGISLGNYFELEVSSGEKKILKKGDLIIGLDTQGQGHKTVNIGSKENHLVMFQLSNSINENT